MPGAWKTVRVFISSTFRDMHAERDHLVKVTFPALRERLSNHRVYLVDVDLRWGVTSEQAENEQVLDLCLQQIDECRPFFVGILGERYGWAPERLPDSTRRRFGWADAHPGASVTELEILHGALRQTGASPRAFFYFRDPAALAEVPEPLRSDVFAETDPERILRLADLKDRIRRNGCPLLDPYAARWNPEAYDRPSRSRGRLDGLEEFGRRVHDDLWAAIRDELRLPETPPAEAAADPLAEEEDYHERFMESRLRVYVGRESLSGTLTAFADDDDPVACLVSGPSGSGKSAALAHFVLDYRRRRPDVLVVPHFVGASPRSSNLREMLRRFCLVLKGRFGFAEEAPEEVTKLALTFRQFLGRVPADVRVLFVIDALNQLDETDRAQELGWLPAELPPHVKVVASCISGSGRTEPVLEEFGRRMYCDLQVAPLGDAERREIIRQVPSLSAKTLDDSQVRALLSNPATTNPLFLLVALEELRGFGSYERLNERIASLPREGDAVTDLFTQVIERLEEEFDAELVREVLTLLASARRGLAERELQDLVAGLPAADDLFPVLRQLRAYLQSRGGLLDFYHRNLFKAVRLRYLDGPAPQRSAHGRLAEYFGGQPSRPSVGTSGTLNFRKLDELPWQQLRAGRPAELEATLTDFDFVMAKCEAGLLYPLLDDYRRALGPGRHAGQSPLALWAAFFEQRVHLLGPADQHWPAHRILLQIAVEHGDDSPVTRAAERWLEEGRCHWTWLRRRTRPAEAPAQACVGSVAVGDSVVDMRVGAAGDRAVVLTGRYVALRNSVDRWALVTVDLRSLEVVRAEPLADDGGPRPRRWTQASELPGAPAAPRVDFRRKGPGAAPGERALKLVGYHIPELTRDWEPVALLDGGRRLVTGTHDGIVRIWDRQALEKGGPSADDDPEARRVLDEARGAWDVDGPATYDDLLDEQRRVAELGLDLMTNAADRASWDTWRTMNRDLEHVAFGFRSPVRIDLFRLADRRVLAAWVSDVPLIEPDYDNVVMTASLMIRAVRSGQGLAVETTTGTATLLTPMRGGRAVDLVDLDRPAEAGAEGVGR